MSATILLGSFESQLDSDPAHYNSLVSGCQTAAKTKQPARDCGLKVKLTPARLAQSVEHGTLTANLRGSKQSQGRGFEPHIGRTF